MWKYILGLLLLCVAGFAVWSWQPAIAPIEPQKRQAFAPELVERGEVLAAMGNCASCHTKPGGKNLAGGLGIATPFGVIHSTNITPDLETGIGRWPEAAFTRAMRQGVDLNGEHLYPAFPYDHYTLLSDDDVHALYAYVMTQESVKSPTPPNGLKFPFSFRPAIAVWKALYFRSGRYRPDAAHDAEWNRGAYLAEGLSHCGACHTPRNFLGAEQKSEAYNGGPIEGWYAYAINATSPAPLPWSKEALQFYLSHGWHKEHGLARGPMVPVVMNLATVPAGDVKAIATYIESLGANKAKQEAQPPSTAARTGDKLASADSLANPDAPDAAKNEPGAAIYAGACAGCHESSRPLPFGGLNLSLSTAINGPTPTDIINVTLFGLPQQPGLPSPIMPGFSTLLTDAQMTSLLNYLRSAFSNRPAWQDVEQDIRNARLKRPEMWFTPPTRAVIANSSQEVAPW